MPTISMFYGIIMYMNKEKEEPHHLPHVHARYQEHNASFDFEGNLLAGSLPQRQRKYVEAWILLHQDELIANWDLINAGEKVFRIDPLR
ncbi:MAG: DUF4160 domain-containing protein [Selenomonadaceae bacterium]|nr:DUF4160 domain-containing protein [Selenomonadaceae bacterium]